MSVEILWIEHLIGLSFDRALLSEVEGLRTNGFPKVDGYLEQLFSPQIDANKRQYDMFMHLR